MCQAVLEITVVNKRDKIPLLIKLAFCRRELNDKQVNK